MQLSDQPPGAAVTLRKLLGAEGALASLEMKAEVTIAPRRRLARLHGDTAEAPPKINLKCSRCGKATGSSLAAGKEALMVVEDEEEEMAAADPCVALRLVAAAAWRVVKERRIRDFPLVLTLLEAVWEAAPDLVHYRHFVKLRLGLQAKVIMSMLQEELPDGKVFDAVDTYFPENEPQPHPKATAQDLTLVQAAQENFRALVLGLLCDCRQREEYVQEHLETDYGAAFMQVVEELFCDYLRQLESTLPAPCFQELLEAACIHGPNQSSPDPDILSRYLTDMGYQATDCPAHPPSPRHSSPQFQRGEEELRTSNPSNQQSSPGKGRRWRSRSPSSQDENSPGNHSGLQLSGIQEMGESGDIVLDSSSESGSSPFKKGEYQCTQHDTLIPTFQEHLQDGNRR